MFNSRLSIGRIFYGGEKKEENEAINLRDVTVFSKFIVHVPRSSLLGESSLKDNKLYHYHNQHKIPNFSPME